MTTLIFGNFYFDYYTYRIVLEFRLGFGLGLGLGLRLGLRVSFFRLYFKMSERMEHSPSLFLNNNSNLIQQSFSECNRTLENKKKKNL